MASTCGRIRALGPTPSAPKQCERSCSHQWSYVWVLVSIGFHCMYWYVSWYVLWYVLVCIDMVWHGITVCIGMYYFWYRLHALVCIGMYSKVICASVDMYWLVAAFLPRLFRTKVPGHTTRAPPVGFELVCIEKMVCIVRIGMYCIVFVCIDLYWPVLDLWYVLVCCDMYLYVMIMFYRFW